MPIAAMIRNFWKNLFQRKQVERDLDDELRGYVDELTERKGREGMTPQAARREALLDFSGLEATRERVRDQRIGIALDSWHQDIRFAFRSLRKDRRFSLLATLTLAITIGGVALMSTLVYSVLLKPLPYPDPDRLVILSERNPGIPISRGRTVRTANFLDWRTQSHSFESMALYRRFVYDIDTDTEPLRAEVWSVSPALFSILGAHPLIGRGFTPEDEQSKAPATAVLSYEFWRSRFHGDPNVLGKTLLFPSHVGVTIVGVLAPGFRAPAVGAMVPGVQIGLEEPPSFPVIWQAYQPSAEELTNRHAGGYTGIARLKADIPATAAAAELTQIAARLASEYPDSNRNITPIVNPLIEEMSGAYKSVLWILLGAVCCVLAIGIGNLINLQMVRNSVRERELSIRAALGASRTRLIRQLMTETVLLSMTGGLAGILAGAAGMRLLLPLLPVGFPRVDQIAIDKMVFLYLIVICSGAGLIFGGIPALRICRPGLIDTLKGAVHSVTATRSHIGLRRFVIALEMALAFILLAGASLLVNSWWRLITAPTGMNETNVWAATITLPPKYRSTADQFAFFPKAADIVRAYPGVESVGLVTSPPLAGTEIFLPDAAAQGSESSAPKGVTLSLRSVTPGYFQALRIPLVRGRFLSNSDTLDALHNGDAGVINESAAQSLFPSIDPIGRTIGSGGRSYKVVGVIADLKMRRLDMPASPQLYASYLQEPDGLPTMLVRMLNGEEDPALGIRRAIASLDKDVQVRTVSMAEVRWQKTATERFRTILLFLFAATALFLSLIGIFGVVSYAVNQRRREIGIRIAIGAGSESVTRLMIRQSMIPTTMGLASGVLAALWLNRFLASFLYEIAPTDVLTFIVVIVLLAGSAFLASYIPARRAGHIDPWTTLRQE